MTEIEIEIDKSHLPRVYDVCQCFSVLEDGALAHSLQEQEIEQFYSSNIQKNQAVQSDVRLARRLQEEEERRARLGHQLQQMEEQDCEYAKMIQEELRRCDEEAKKREEEDEEMAKRMQEEEELEMQRQRAQAGYHGDSRASPLSEGLELWEQLVRDAELARILQEEEDRQPHQKSRGSDVDFRTAQVAQDEEIARYMQRQERKNSRKSHDLETQERSLGLRGADNTTSRKVEPLQMPRERLNSEGLHSPVEEEHTLEQHPLSPACTTLRTQPVHNIAEELDPTFTARKRDSQISPSPSSGICLAPRTPHSIFYDYLPEPNFVPPTRRHSDKPGRPKAKEKRENCKQQ
ncbi:coiled-coil domain-containing protein 50 isoform X2 [Pygocentrus nattereri]|uniref:coiled-coil domain-containing protein 50 isoform X2 n=1 Tax=Pygocentrus nattereri TaxID=42514 RepID=UPI000814B07D|nr:coiled-coil domain-containing protein 50 isoform X2 [Pygocentrus nattereri]